MPGEHTLYRKIQVVLGYAKDGKHSDTDTLVDYVANRKPTNFIYYYRDRTTDKIQHGYSEKSIKRAIMMCCDLKFLRGPSLELTGVGVRASDPRRFRTIVAKKAIELLAGKGVALNMLEDSIRGILHGETPEPPTARAIWHHLELPRENIDFVTFGQLLNLLGQSQQLSMSQRRIYLPVSSAAAQQN